MADTANSNLNIKTQNEICLIRSELYLTKGILLGFAYFSKYIYLILWNKIFFLLIFMQLLKLGLLKNKIKSFLAIKNSWNYYKKI